MGVDPIEREDHTRSEREKPQAAVFRPIKRHGGADTVRMHFHATGESSGIKELCQVGHRYFLHCVLLL